MDDKYHKYRKGKVSIEVVTHAMDDIQMTSKIRSAIIDYFVNGKMINDTGVKAHVLSPYLRLVNSNITTSSFYVKRFLYTDDFSPRKGLSESTQRSQVKL